MMTKAVAQKELLNHLASFRFWAGAVLAVVLAASSTWIAARDYNLRLSGYRDRVAGAQRTLSAVSVYSYLQPLAIRPPEPLSVFDQGFESRLGTDVAIHLFAIPDEAAGGQRGNEFLGSTPAVDLTTVVSVVLGLLALLLTCDAVNGEREDGTLRAVLAHGVPRRTVLAGKLAGGLLALCLPLGTGLLVSLSIYGLQVRAPLTPDQWLRVGGLAVSYLLYLVLALLLGLLISLSVRGSSRALGLSVLLWFLFAIVVPGAAWAVAGDLVSTEGVKRSTERAVADLTADYERRLARERRRVPLRVVASGYTALSFASGEHRAVRYRQGSAPYYDALAGYHRFEAATGARYAAQAFALRQRYEERLRQGERLGTALASLSPAFLLGRLSEAFAGTSIAEHDRFLAACRRYRSDLLAYLERQGAWRSWRWFTDDPPGGLHPWPLYLGLSPEEVRPGQVSRLFSRLSEPAVEARIRQDREAIQNDPSRRLSLAGMPRFSYRGPSFLSAFHQGAAYAGALLILAAFAAAAVWARFQRYDLG
jgi:ABC-type transport system involved in multi-copper enzyme maturation permease subunit